MPESTILSSVHKPGHILLNNNKKRLLVSTVLFDTGALHGNYISLSFVNKYKSLLQPFLYPSNGMVKLADNKTIIKITQLAVLFISFLGHNNIEHTAEITFCVFPTTSNDMIIGLPAIVDNFSELLKEMIDEAVINKVELSTNNNNKIIINNIIKEKPMENSNTLFPWNQIDLEAPEDIDTDLPCSFSYALHFMEMSTSEALKEYESLIL